MECAERTRANLLHDLAATAQSAILPAGAKYRMSETSPLGHSYFETTN